MITIKNKIAAQKMAVAGKNLASIFNEISEIIVFGISTLDIDAFVVERLKKHNMISKSKGYMGYKYSSCISVNEEIVHGVPSATRRLQSGDLVKVDVCASWKGYCAD